MKLFTTRYRGEAYSARPARAGICSFASSCGFHGEALADVECAAGEAIANAIEHGNRSHGWFTVTCSFRQGLLSVEIKDRGPGFEVPIPPPVRPRFVTRGWGLFMMRALVDSVTFEENGTRVRLEKRLPLTA
jgi:anti-sigma regulatory factor (Ser/Thr protein kinase)